MGKKKEKKKKLKNMLAENKANGKMDDSNSEETLTKIKAKKKKKKIKNADADVNGVVEKNNLFGTSDNDWNPQDAVIKATPSPIGHNFFKKSKKSHSAEL